MSEEMNVLFLTLLEFGSIKERTIYSDLLREFVKNGHQVYVISPIEKRSGRETHIVEEENATILRLRIGNTQKTNVIEKGINTLLIESKFKKAIKRYFAEVKFDLVLYSTPPVTLVSAIQYVKKRDGAFTYLLLKDIFPQNAVDIGMLSKRGAKGILYRFFRNKERKLYSISDAIGCMSEANVEYILAHNPDVSPAAIEVCPNCIEVIDKRVEPSERKRIRDRYGIPLDKKIYVYGGNLGKPQGIPFLTECLKKCADQEDAFFLIIGDGTEYPAIERYLKTSEQTNVKLMRRLPKEDYDTMVGACDVGLIFLDHRFTIPNFPSRILSYMSAALPVLAFTDPNTDVGRVIVEGGFGWWCESNDAEAAKQLIAAIAKMDCEQQKRRSYLYLNDHYSAQTGYQIIMDKIEALQR